MTSFAGPNIISCPNCGQFLQQRRLATFNDFGATGWTDGYSSIWGLSIASLLGRCPCCRGIFWYNDVQTLGVLPPENQGISKFARLMLYLTGDKRGTLGKERAWNGTPTEWKIAVVAGIPDLQDWRAALEDQNSLTPAREMIARRKLWWGANDCRRYSDAGAHPSVEIEGMKENLDALLLLHASLPEPDQSEHAEVLRELGRFDEAIELLASIDVSKWGKDDERHLRVSKILACARDRDALVREVWRNEPIF